MSSATAFGAGKVRRRSPNGSAPAVRAFILGLIALDLGIIAAGVVVSRNEFVEAGWGLIAWAIAVGLVGAASIPFQSGQQLGLDMPILLSAGFIFGPIIAGSLAFVAYIDGRELRGEIPLVRALFNRAQTSLSVIAAASVYEAVRGDSEEWPLALLAAFVAVGADCIVNYGNVVVVLSLHERTSLWEGLLRLSFGSISDFAVTYACFGLVSVMLAETYRSVGVWSLAVFAIPVLLARQAFNGHRKMEESDRRVRAQANALRDVSSKVADERREERLTLAAGLHDEVLPPLHHVHLMGQVLRQDLATGRLLALEEDLPQLLQATESASEKMRALIRSLKNSPLGAGGLSETLQLLVSYLQRDSAIKITLECGSVGGTPLTQLLAYQVIREAARNSLKHSGASNLVVTVSDEHGFLQLSVLDDGVGFDPDSVDQEHHFGLTLMRERVELAGGELRIETRRGEGTRLTAKLPTGVPI